MAEGDSWNQQFGTAQEDRQPVAGVEEEVSFSLKPGITSNAMAITNGSQNLQYLVTLVSTSSEDNSVAKRIASNLKLIIDNTYYLRKLGVSGLDMAGGVQVG